MGGKNKRKQKNKKNDPKIFLIKKHEIRIYI